MKPQPIIFANLDGAFVDHATCLFEEVLPSLERIRKEGIPRVLCSSKTRAEIECWRKRFENLDPFISENGGGVFIPYGSSISLPELEAVWPRIQMTNRYYTLVFGTPNAVLMGVLDTIKAEGFEVKGFKDMDVTEVAELTGLILEDARLAKRRDFDEPF